MEAAPSVRKLCGPKPGIPAPWFGLAPLGLALEGVVPLDGPPASSSPIRPSSDQSCDGGRSERDGPEGGAGRRCGAGWWVRLRVAARRWVSTAAQAARMVAQVREAAQIRLAAQARLWRRVRWWRMG